MATENLLSVCIHIIFCCVQDTSGCPRFWRKMADCWGSFPGRQIPTLSPEHSMWIWCPKNKTQPSITHYLSPLNAGVYQQQPTDKPGIVFPLRRGPWLEWAQLSWQLHRVQNANIVEKPLKEMGGGKYSKWVQNNIFNFSLKLHQSTCRVNTGSHNHSCMKARIYGALRLRIFYIYNINEVIIQTQSMIFLFRSNFPP